jgi:hypothetical protein
MGNATRKSCSSASPATSIEPWIGSTTTSSPGNLRTEQLSAPLFRTRVVCNPRGYPGEYGHAGFKPDLLSERRRRTGNSGLLSLLSHTVLGCPESQARRALMALGPSHFDTATDRSVLSSMRVIRQDVGGYLNRFPNVMNVDPVATSCHLTRRPASIHGGHSSGRTT